MGKYDLGGILDAVKKKEKDTHRKGIVRLGSEGMFVSQDPKDYIVMPEEMDWEDATGVPGLPYRKICQIAGKSDTGKTSGCIKAIKAAQEQGVAVMYVETECKTSVQDLEAWGVDTENLFLVQDAILENNYTMMLKLWDEFFDKYPDGRMLLVVDSWGNNTTKRDEHLDLDDSQQPGGKAKQNRRTVEKMVAKMAKGDHVAVLVSNYNYGNIGSVGRTNAGGEAIHFYTYIGFQTTRVAWLVKTRDGVKRRVGAKVKWSTYKNHAAKSLGIDVPDSVTYEITKDGFKRVL